MLVWLSYQRGCEFSADACAAAAKSHQAASALQYLHSIGVPFGPDTMATAVSCQEVPLLQWLYEQGCCEFSEKCALIAAQLKDLSVLSWLHSKGCICSYKEMCRTAASTGNIATLQWAKATAVTDWSPEALSVYLNFAAAYEHLDTAKVSETLYRISSRASIEFCMSA
jgi:hypothetical protein